METLSPDVATIDMPQHVRRLTVHRLRTMANRMYEVTSCVLVGACTFVAWAAGQNVALTFVMTGIAAAMAHFGIRAFETRLPARLMVTLSFDLQIVILIFATSRLSSAYVEEAHTVYAVLNLYLLAYACWRSLVFYNAFIIVHHLTITYAMPQVLWGDAATWEGIYHTSIHSLLALALTGSFGFTAEHLRRTLRSNEKALVQAGAATDAAQASADHAKRNHVAAENRALLARETAVGIDDQLQTLFQNMLSAAVSVGGSATSVAAVSRTCSENTGIFEGLFDKTASDIDEVALAADTLARSVDEIAQRAESAAQKSQGAVVETELAARLVKALSVSGQRVGDMTRVIRTIAQSINLLALNATLQAARAGQAGRGFAVVAQNIKALASQTSKATAEIVILIAKIQDETQAAVRAFASIGETIAAARDHASEIAAATAQQKVMTTSIAQSAATIAEEAGEVRAQLKETLNLLVSANAMSSDLLQASDGLRQTAETSTQGCVQLLTRLRTA